MRTKTEQTPRLTVSALKQRGWTEALIRNFLGGSDATRPNPHYRTGPPMRLYDEPRVLAVEASEDFETAFAKARQRSERAKRAAREQERVLIEAIQRVPLRIERLPFEDLRVRAIAHYNARNEHRDRYATLDSDRDFLRRIMMNYARHRLCDYDPILAACRGRVGILAAYSVLKERVMTASVDTYPELGG